MTYILLCLLLAPSLVHAQRGQPRPQPNAAGQGEAPVPQRDSLPPGGQAPTPPDATGIPAGVLVADGDLEDKIEYNAKDSIFTDVVDNVIYLYGEAYVKYQTFELKAAYIVFDQGKDEVMAEAVRDENGRLVGVPDFKDGEQAFRARKVRYNYKTGKGIVSNVTTQENDLYLLSGATQYLKDGGHDEDHDHHNHAEDVVYSKDALITTCNHPDPHFGIRSKKQKVIANKLVVTGPANLEIGGVPTPVWLPFAVYPIKKGVRNGLIFPRDYENSPSLGFGLREVGYYWALGGRADFQLTGDIYTKGSWRIHTKTRYYKRYKFRGHLNLDYNWIYNPEIVGEIGRDLSKSFVVDWRYDQDPAANPNFKFSANANFQINDARRVNNNDFNSVFNNILRSNINLTKPLKSNGKAMGQFTLSVQHSQNTQLRDFKMDLPRMKLSVNRIQPFKRKVRTGKERWYEKIGLRYTADAVTKVDTKDTLLFTPGVFDDFKYGMRQDATMDASFRVFKYFNLTPRMTYSESWFPKSIGKQYGSTTSIVSIDTLYNGSGEIISLDTVYDTSSKLDTIHYNRFSALRQMTAGVNLNTEVFSTLQFERGWLQGIRYTMRPTLGFSYTPDYTEDGWGYVKTYEKDGREVQYSVFEGNVFNQTPSRSGRQMNLTYGVQNVFELKHKTRRDSTKASKIVKLFDNFGLNGSYNFAADSLNWSPLTGTAAVSIWKGVTRISANVSLDPYIEDEAGRRINTTIWSARGKLLRLDGLTAGVRTNIAWSQIKKWLGLDTKKDKPSHTDSQQQQGPLGGQQQNVSQDYSNRFLNNVSFSHTFNFRTSEKGPEVSAHSVRAQAAINLSPKWHFNIRNIGYNIKDKKLVYPDVSISRDLHCWQMGMSWQPQRGTYSFYLRVNPGTLDFISVPWSRNQFDTGRF